MRFGRSQCHQAVFGARANCGLQVTGRHQVGVRPSQVVACLRPKRQLAGLIVAGYRPGVAQRLAPLAPRSLVSFAKGLAQYQNSVVLESRDLASRD